MNKGLERDSSTTSSFIYPNLTDYLTEIKQKPTHNDSVWETQQIQTFLAWCNFHLKKADVQIQTIDKDFRDGLNLLLLLEQVTGEQLPKPEHGEQIWHKIANVNKALKFLESHGVKLVSIGAEEIVNGNLKITLGLIWSIIAKFAVKLEDLSGEEALLSWCRQVTKDYKNISIDNFGSSFRDGLALCALIHSHHPHLIDYETLNDQNPIDNLNLAFDIAQKHFKIPNILNAKELVKRPDVKSMMVYVSLLYHEFNREKQNMSKHYEERYYVRDEREMPGDYEEHRRSSSRGRSSSRHNSRHRNQPQEEQQYYRQKMTRSGSGSSISSISDYDSRGHERPLVRCPRDVIRAPTPPPVIQRVVERAPTPEADIVERVIVRPQPQQLIERIIERPRTPPPKIIDKEICEPAPPPIVRTRIVKVDHSPRHYLNNTQQVRYQQAAPRYEGYDYPGYENSYSTSYSTSEVFQPQGYAYPSGYQTAPAYQSQAAAAAPAQPQYYTQAASNPYGYTYAYRPGPSQGYATQMDPRQYNPYNQYKQ